MLVVITHCGFAYASGALGVNVFFFLSGFLITTLLRREFTKYGEVSFRKFYIRRSLRIFPPMYLLLAVATAVSLLGLLPPRTSLGVTIAQFLHLTNYAHITGSSILPGTEIMWSLCVEEHFYLIFPVVFVALARMRERPRAVFVVGTCLLILAWRCFVVATNPTPGVTGEAWAYEASDTRMDSILWGAALAMFANPFFEPERTNRLDRPIYGVLAVVILLASQAYQAHWYSHSIRYTLQCMCFVPLFVLAIRRPQSLPFSLLNRQPLRWIGVVSYSLYLNHYIVIALLKHYTTLSRPLLVVATLAITLPICALIERFIEQPAARLRKRYAA